MGQAPLQSPSRQNTTHLPGHQGTAYVRTICRSTLTLCSPMVRAKLQSQRVNGPSLISCFGSNLANGIHWRPQSKNNRCIFSSQAQTSIK